MQPSIKKEARDEELLKPVYFTWDCSICQPCALSGELDNVVCNALRLQHLIGRKRV
jgi:hypothetical protein